MSLNPANTPYSVRALSLPVYVRGRANTAQLQVEHEAELLVPTAATYTLTDPTGATVVSASATIAGDGTVSYALTSGHLPSTATLSTAYQETWTLTIDGASFVRDRSVAVAVRDWSPPIVQADLTDALATLGAYLPSGTTSLQRWITEAWRQILTELEGAGVFPQRVMSPERFRNWHRHLTLALFFESCALGQKRGNFAEMADKEFERAIKAQERCTARLDQDDDGRPDDEGDLRSMSRGPIYANAAPTGAHLVRSVRW